MSNKFKKWFNETYNKWAHNQSGEEDFLEFCSQLGYPPYQVLSWLHGKSIPVESEVLGLAGLLGIEVYDILKLEKPEQELLNIYDKFSHLRGEYRRNLSHALWEVQTEIELKYFHKDSKEIETLLNKSMNKWNIS